MKPEKSILINFVFVLFYILVAWFLVLVPYSKAKAAIQQLPVWVNSNLIEKYPVDLTISVKKGLVSLNRPSPYCLILPFDTTSTDQLLSGIIIDTNAAADFSALESNGIYSKLCQPMALVGRDFILYPDEKNTYKYSKIPESANVDINRENITTFVHKYLPMVTTFGQRAYFILPFTGVLFFFSGFLTMNFWYALVVKLISKIFASKPLSFGESYNLSLFFYNFVLFVDWVLIKYVLNVLFNQNLIISFPFLNTVIITIASILYLKKTPAQPISTSTPTGQ